MKNKILTTVTAKPLVNQPDKMPKIVVLEGEYIAKERYSLVQHDLSAYYDTEHPTKPVRFLDIYI